MAFPYSDLVKYVYVITSYHMGSFYFNILLKKITLPAHPRMAWLY